jgi:hypothetical protein
MRAVGVLDIAAEFVTGDVRPCVAVDTSCGASVGISSSCYHVVIIIIIIYLFFCKTTTINGAE